MLTSRAFGLEEFSSRRREAQGRIEDALRPLVRRALDTATNTGGWSELLDEVAHQWRLAYQDERGDPGPGMPRAMRAELLDALKKTDRANATETTVDRIAIWLSTAVLAHATATASDDDEEELFMEWVTMGDSHVREAHRDAAGQIKPIGERFSVSNYKMPYPGYPGVPIELWINCRCTLRPVLASEVNSMTASQFRDVGPEERKKDADAGRAMPDGSYPIDNCGDLKNAIQAIGRAKDPAAVKRHIKKRKRALGCPDVELPEDWSLTAADVADDTVCIMALPAADDPVHGIGEEEKHATLLYFGRVSEHEEPQRMEGEVTDLLPQVLAVAARNQQPFTAKVTGIEPLGHDDPPAQVWLLESPELQALFTDIPDIDHEVASLYDGAAATRYPEYKPHVTIGYGDYDAEAASAITEITFDRLAVWHGEDRYEFALGQQEEDMATEDPITKDDAGDLDAPGDATDAAPIEQIAVPWHGVLAPEGVKSGDGRAFREGALTHRPLPLPLTWQKTSADGHLQNVVVGRIEQMVRVGNEVHATGTMLMTPEADEAVYMMASFGKFGVSIDADAAEVNTEGWDLDPEDPEYDPTMWFDSGRVCAACMVAIPAFAEAWVGLGEAPEGFMDGEAMLTEEPEAEALVASAFWKQFVDVAPGVTEDGPGWLTHPVDTDRLRDYWVHGEGAAKIGWGVPGDFDRCRTNLAEYVKPQYLNGYCFTGDTEFLTRDGVKTFEETVGTSQMVLTHKAPVGSGEAVSKAGYWVEAPIEPFGEQPVLSVTLKRGKRRKVIRATAEHEWFVSSDARSAARRHTSQVTTADLRPGMAMASLMPMPVAKRRSEPSPVGIMAGIVYGDGTVAKDSTGASVDLWGEKDANLLPYFDLCPQSPRKTQGGVEGVRVKGLPASFKSKPSLNEGFSYLMGWLAGYIAADGTVNQNGAVILQSADRGSLEFAAVVANRLGISTLPIRERTRSGFGRPEAVLYSLGFVGETFPESMLLIPAHRINFHEPKFTSTRWVVESVEDHGEIEQVYCAVVPETETFALADYVWTHNCANRHKDALGVWPGQEASMRDVMKESEMSESVSLVASAYEVPTAAPAAWFRDPEFAPDDGRLVKYKNGTYGCPMTITEEGQVFGHIATWKECHSKFGDNRCILAPHSATGYAHFLLGAVLTDEGQVPVGSLTIGTGHAGERLTAAQAQRHYDDSGAVFADVTVGEDEYGIWMAGWVRPGTPTEMVHAARASKLSGDWRKIGGQLEMIAALAVNVPGFRVPRIAASITAGEVTSLVAAGALPGHEDAPTMEGLDVKVLAAHVVDEIERRQQQAASWNQFMNAVQSFAPAVAARRLDAINTLREKVSD